MCPGAWHVIIGRSACSVSGSGRIEVRIIWKLPMETPGEPICHTNPSEFIGTIESISICVRCHEWMGGCSGGLMSRESGMTTSPPFPTFPSPAKHVHSSTINAQSPTSYHPRQISPTPKRIDRLKIPLLPPSSHRGFPQTTDSHPILPFPPWDPYQRSLPQSPCPRSPDPIALIVSR